jgi:hypothetical protein
MKSILVSIVLMMGVWSGLISLLLHHAAVYAWLAGLGYWLWVVVLMFIAVLVMAGHWLYATGRRP